MAYLSQYGLEEDCPTILRGTLRYPGFCSVVEVFRRIGLLGLEEVEGVEKWERLVDVCLGRGGEEWGLEERREKILELVEGDEALVEVVLRTLEE